VTLQFTGQAMNTLTDRQLRARSCNSPSYIALKDGCVE
jgi:hypothetical protein